MLADFMGVDTPERRAQFIASIPLGRLSQPSDIATAAVGIVVCADRSKLAYPGLWPVDCAAATEKLPVSTRSQKTLRVSMCMASDVRRA